MAFKMRSGNKVSFKNMGSSPIKQNYVIKDIDKTFVTDKNKDKNVCVDGSCPVYTDEEKKAMQDKLDAQIKGTYVETDKDVAERKKRWKEDKPKNRSKKKSPAKQRKSLEVHEGYRKALRSAKMAQSAPLKPRKPLPKPKPLSTGVMEMVNPSLPKTRQGLKGYRKDQPKHYHTRTEERTHPDDKKKKKSPTKAKDFNMTGSSASTTPGYKETKIAKAKKFKQKFDARQVSKQKGKDFVKNLKTKGDLVSKKPASILDRTTKAFKNTPKQFAKNAKTILATNLKSAGKQIVKKGAGRLVGAALGPVTTVAGLAYGAYKSGQKHSGGKAVKGQKTGIVTPDPKKSIYNQPKKSIYDKKK